MAIKGTTISGQFYLVQNPDLSYSWFDRDPMKCPASERVPINIGDTLKDFFSGDSPVDITNPIIVRVKGAQLNRCEKFSISAPAAIRARKVDKHIEDLEGSLIEVLEVRGLDPAFPINAVIYNSDGAIVGYRTYSLKGFCSDEIEDHRIVVVDGPMPVERYDYTTEDETEGEAEGKTAEDNN